MRAAIAGSNSVVWSSRFAVYLGTAGAAVGLGSIWRFPYLAGTGGGSAFILVFVLACVLIATPLLAAEFALGRRSRRNPPEAAGVVATEAGLSSRWNAIGVLISARGLQRGIEVANKIRAPGFLVLLLILVVYSLSTGDVRRGLAFAFTPRVRVFIQPVVWMASLAFAPDKTVFGVMDYVSSNIMLPMGALLTSVFVGWRLNKVFISDELAETPLRFRTACIWLLRYLCPLAILAVFTANLF
jgi:SNF family Na+-dependent transporter